MRTGAQVLVDQLRINDVDTIFSVPGESFLAVIDALYDIQDEIRFITTRHEGGAANMAEAYAKLTGKPGVCFVTRGPGATNASIGLHTAAQDSTPLVLLIGQVARGHFGREAFQEVDFAQHLGPLTKWAAQVESAERLPEMLSRAFHTAQQGRPGPVALALPEDLLDGPVDVADAAPARIALPHPGEADLQALQAMLAGSSRPLMVVGGGAWSAQTGRDVAEFATANRIPTCASFRCQDFIDNQSDIYVGTLGLGVNPALAARVKDSDLLISVGARLGDIATSAYSLVEVPVPSQRLVHVYPGAEELGRVHQAELPINSGAAQFAAAARSLAPVDSSAWAEWMRQARSDYLAHRTPPGSDLDLDLAEIVSQLRESVPDDAVMTNGAGNFSVWAHRFYEFREFPTQLGPRSGAMGYGIPAAVAAKVVHPERVAVCFTGDGDALMTFAELATAVQYDLDPIVIVFNNGRLGTIRMHQERRFPGRTHGTELVNPDFVRLAEAFGAHAERVERTSDFLPALERCLRAGTASVIELQTDPDQLTPGYRASST